MILSHACLDKPSFVKLALKVHFRLGTYVPEEVLMTGIARPMLTNFQVALHWPARRRRQSLPSRARELLQLWRLRLRQRAELARLGEQGLHDIGQSNADAYRELAKWFWQE
jgi:uncharacterized protein YjiS (DUF1127 family)